MDINYNAVDVCCKDKDTVLRAIYYFIVNPFKQIEDYHCKHAAGSSRETDTARFANLGPLNITFNEIVYPSCSIGRMGFGPNSEFFSLMPNGGQYLTIEQEDDPQRKGQHWRMVIGGDISTQFVFAPVLQGNDWSFKASTINFNDYSFSNANKTQAIRQSDSSLMTTHSHFQPKHTSS